MRGPSSAAPFSDEHASRAPSTPSLRHLSLATTGASSPANRHRVSVFDPAAVPGSMQQAQQQQQQQDPGTLASAWQRSSLPVYVLQPLLQQQALAEDLFNTACGPIITDITGAAGSSGGAPARGSSSGSALAPGSPIARVGTLTSGVHAATQLHDDMAEWSHLLDLIIAQDAEDAATRGLATAAGVTGAEHVPAAATLANGSASYFSEDPVSSRGRRSSCASDYIHRSSSSDEQAAATFEVSVAAAAPGQLLPGNRSAYELTDTVLGAGSGWGPAGVGGLSGLAKLWHDCLV